MSVGLKIQGTLNFSKNIVSLAHHGVHCALVVHIAPDGAHKAPVYHWNGAQGCLRKPTHPHTHTHARDVETITPCADAGCKDLLCNLTNKEHLIVWLWSLFTHKLKFHCVCLLRRKPQEENLRRFWNKMGYPLKFTQLPIHRYHKIWLWSSLHFAVTFLAGNGKNWETPFKSRGVYGGSR